MDQNICSIITGLFSNASGNSLEFLYTVLRVGSIENFRVDPLVSLQRFLLSKASIDSKYQKILESKDFWHLLVNLQRSGKSLSYHPYAIDTQNETSYVDRVLSQTDGNLQILLKELFTNSEGESPQEKKIREDNAVKFCRVLLLAYNESRKQFKDVPKIYKLPRFEVLELLVNSKEGIYGFRRHFSNDTYAEYVRKDKSTMAVNIMPDDSGVGYQIGPIDELKHEWRLNGKRLYETGLPGKYNEIGTWRPIVYPGNYDKLQQEAHDASEDRRVQGALFYMYTTGYRVLEFAVKTKIDLGEKCIFPGEIHMVRVGKDEDLENEIIYDGWINLKDGSVNTVSETLDVIQRTMSGLAFAYRSSVIWESKYSLYGNEPAAALLQKKDFKPLNALLGKIQEYKDPIIDASLDWFLRGTTSGNKFNEFLCYHIAIEGLAVKLMEGKLPTSANFGVSKKTTTEKDKLKIKCIEEYYAQYYSTDPIEFVKNVVDCIGSIRIHLEDALKKVFGENNPIIKEYFEGQESILNIRGRITHGDFSEWNKTQANLVFSKLHRVKLISRAFLFRVILGLKPNEKVPKLSTTFRFSVNMTSPKGALVTSSLKFIPKNDWIIKAEWIS